MKTKRNLDVIRLLGKRSPDHKTITLFRSENGETLKNVFRDFKEPAAIDGSERKAENGKERNLSETEEPDRPP